MHVISNCVGFADPNDDGQVPITPSFLEDDNLFPFQLVDSYLEQYRFDHAFAPFDPGIYSTPSLGSGDPPDPVKEGRHLKRIFPFLQPLYRLWFMVCALSVVIPAYNEEGCLRELYQRLSPVLRGTGLDYEILFVDDGSTDATFRELRRLAEEDDCVSAVRLSRNFGHQAALTAGLALAKGKAVITMDADLQHPPELIPTLIEKWREGHEVVYTVRGETADSGLSKEMTASLYYRLLNFLSPIPIVPGAADFRLLDRKAVDALNAMPERARFFRGLVPWIGFRQTSVSFNAPERFSGETKYSFLKMFRLALHGILSLSAMPLRMATLVGAMVVVIGLLYGVYVVWTAFFNPESQQGWASIVLVALLLGGTQIFFMGVIGEYLARVFEEVKARPQYLIAETVGSGHPENESHEPV